MKARMGRLPDWNDYLRALQLRFWDNLYDDLMVELVALKPTGTVQEFLDKFDGMINQVELTEEYSSVAS